MRYLYILLLPVIASLAISCNDDSERNRVKRSINNLEVYVDSLERVHKSRELKYTQAEWNHIDSGYEARRENVRMQIDPDDAGNKNNTKLDDIDNRYQTLKTNYEQQRQARMDEATRGLEGARNALNITDENDGAQHINTENFLTHYNNFVDTVDKYKRVFGTKDWDRADAYRNALKNRQEAINNNFTANDKLKIAELDTKYGALKIHKIGAKIEEETNNNF